MAFVDIYGAVESTSSGEAELDVVDELNFLPLQQLLPPGVAWNREMGTNLSQLLLAMSYEYSRIKRRARDLIEEIDPRTTYEMLEDWERVFGLPGECTQPTTLSGRRAALLGKMLGFGSPTKQYFIDLAEQLGYTSTINTYTGDDMFTCVSDCTDSLYTELWMYVWDVFTEMGDEDEVLECTIEGLAPDHTLPRFFFQLPADAWVDQAGGGSQDLHAVAYGTSGQGPDEDEAGWIAVGENGRIVNSLDGLTWNEDIVGTTDFRGVAFGNFVWVAVGLLGKIESATEIDTWHNRTSGTVLDIYAVSYGGGRFVAVGQNGLVLVSTDGATWNDFTWGVGNHLYGVGYDAASGLWVAVGEVGSVITSDDGGETWTDQSGDMSNDMYSVTFVDTQWIAVGAAGDIYTSNDAISWTLQTSGVSQSLNAIVAGPNAVAVVVGETDAGIPVILRSADGVTWVAPATIEGVEILLGLVRIGSKWVAVGESGSIETSGI